jgi:hypothetical protein
MKPRVRLMARWTGERFTPRPGTNPHREMLQGLARGIATTHPDEIDCDECFQKFDEFVEMTLTGKDAAEVMPLVQDHLDRCGDCREEFEALLAAFRAVT